MMNTEMRTEFEKLPEINRYIRMYCVFNSKTGNYEAKSKHNHLHELRAEYVNGAWMAYQEQQKRIDALEAYKEQLLDDLNNITHTLD